MTKKDTVANAISMQMKNHHDHHGTVERLGCCGRGCIDWKLHSLVGCGDDKGYRHKGDLDADEEHRQDHERSVNERFRPAASPNLRGPRRVGEDAHYSEKDCNDGKPDGHDERPCLLNVQIVDVRQVLKGDGHRYQKDGKHEDLH